MRVIPVLDLLGGIVVHGVAGKRDEYRAVESVLADGSDALAIARGFREHLGLNRLYVADLDAILHGRPNLDALRQLVSDGFKLLVDAGLRDDPAAARKLIELGATQIVLGLETCSGPEFCASFVREIGTERIVFSLDMKHGAPLVSMPTWETDQPLEIASRAVEAGITQMIVLDLAQVGVGAGVSTRDLCRELLQRWPWLRVVTGGGVRGADDLRAMQSWGVDGVLVATALHRGTINRAAISALS